MKCSIEYVGKLRTGVKQYYCSVHKSLASDKFGNRLEECLCSNKKLYDNRLNIKDTNIENIKVVYKNILKNTIPKILIDDKEFEGVLEYDNSFLGYKDLGGIMLSKLNNISLEPAICSRCNHYHSDNGKFAYTPHLIHRCQYCGHLFRAKVKNIGNEFEVFYNIPDILLEDCLIDIENCCSIEYDLFNGVFLINGQKGNRVLFKNKEINVRDFLNDILENEF